MPAKKSNNEPPLEKFFHEQLKDMYYVEKQLVKALEEMKHAASSEELEDAFDNHKFQTERHLKRLEKFFGYIGIKTEGKKCLPMDGLIHEGKELIKKFDGMTRDAALIVAAQKVEHYEIASYGSLVQIALTLGEQKSARLLQKTLGEEEDADQLLTFIAESHINFEAEQEEEESAMEEELV